MRTRAKSHDLDVRLLRTFLAVVEHGTFGKTAVALKKTQPAVSQQILQLEATVGHKLLIRGRSGINLTHHGELLANYANRVLQLNEEALFDLRQESTTNRVTLGISPDIALTELAPALRKVQSIHSDLELKIMVASPDQLEHLLKAGRLDLVVAAPDFITGVPTARWQVPMEWAASKYLDIIDSTPIPLVLFEGPCLWQDRVLTSLRHAGLEYRIAVKSASLGALVAAAESGLGLAVISPSVLCHSRLFRVQNLGLPDPPYLQFGLYQAPVLSKNAQAMLDVILESASEGKAEIFNAKQFPWFLSLSSSLARSSYA